MKYIELKKLAEKIIAKNQYMTIATVDSSGNPWAAPVAYVYDKDWNFYFCSLPDSKHSRNIESKNKAVVAIFDSHQKWGTGVGLQIEGEIKKVPFFQVPAVIKNYFSRRYPYGRVDIIKKFSQGLKKMLQDKIYRLYCFTPKKFWMNDPRQEIDVRVKVNLK